MPASNSNRPHANSDERVAVGVVVGAHGIRGQVKIKSFTTNPYDITAYGTILNKDGTRRFDLSIDAETKGTLIATLKGVKDRNAAELMRGTELFVAKDRIPEPEEDEFYYDDLIGLEVRAENGEVLGSISAVQNYGAGDVVEMKLASTNQKELYPFTKATFPSLHIAEGYCIADLPDIVEAKGEKS